MNIMKHFMGLHIAKTKWVCTGGMILLVILAAVSLIVGKYPLSIEKLLSGDELQWRVFFTLRMSRTVIALIGGFVLGTAGYVYQTVFRNHLAAPDMIGVSSGASAGAAVGILFLSGTMMVTLTAFAGALLAVAAVLLLAGLDRGGKNSTIVLAGIAVHSLAQMVLMILKLTADPQRQLASIEYWIMGSLNGISLYSMLPNMLICIICLIILFLLHRQVILLSADEGEAKMLGVNVKTLRMGILLTATLAVAAVISLTGLISFVGLLAPHAARLLIKKNRISTMFVSGLSGGILLCGADILARSVAVTELPVSIFTSLIGAPFLIILLIRERRNI